MVSVINMLRNQAHGKYMAANQWDGAVIPQHFITMLMQIKIWNKCVNLILLMDLTRLYIQCRWTETRRHIIIHHRLPIITLQAVIIREIQIHSRQDNLSVHIATEQAQLRKMTMHRHHLVKANQDSSAQLVANGMTPMCLCTIINNVVTAAEPDMRNRIWLK